MYIIFNNNKDVNMLITQIINLISGKEKYYINNNTLNKMLISTGFGLFINNERVINILYFFINTESTIYETLNSILFLRE